MPVASFHRGRDVLDILLADALHLYQRGRFAVEPQRLVCVSKAVDDRGHVLQIQAGTVGPGLHHQLFELVAPVRLTLRAQQHLAGCGFDGAARQVERTGTHRARHFVEAEAVAAQRLFRHLDGDLVGARVGDGCLGDAGELRDVVANLVAQLLECAFVFRPGDGDVQHVPHVLYECDDRLLGFLGKRVDGVDAVFHIVQRFGLVGVFEELHADAALAFVGVGGDFFHPFDAFQLFLDAYADAFLHLFRCRTEIRH